MAAALIGVKGTPQGLQELQLHAAEAEDYNRLRPYPLWQFQTWKTEEKGPLPRCMPLPKRIVRRGATFLFGKGIEINCPNNPELETYLRTAWNGNQMPSRTVAMATKGAIEGNVVLKFSFDPDLTPSLRIYTLSLVDQVRLYYSPHDRQQLLMARVQYKYWDPTNSAYYWYREEWTDAEYVVYKPIKDSEWLASLTALTPKTQYQDPDAYTEWQIATREPNPFAVIPVVAIKNFDTDDLYGCGDLWELFRVIDDLNLVWYQMRRSNQFDSELNPWLIDLEVDEEYTDRPISPGEPVNASSTSDTKQGKVEFPAGGNNLRTSMMEYAKQLRKEIEDAAGTVNVGHEDFTNKGNMTQSVLQQLYSLLIETTNEKRKTYGMNGIEIFLEKAAVGLAKHGITNFKLNPKDHDSFDVQVAWPDSFELTEDEKTSKEERITEEVASGFLTQERGTKIVAQMEGIRDIPALLDELKAEPRPSPTETDPTLPPPLLEPAEGK